MHRILVLIITLITAIFCLSGCCEYTVQTHAVTQRSKHGRFRFYDELPNGTKIWEYGSIYVATSPNGDVAMIKY